MDARTPVIVAAAQHTPEDRDAATSALRLLATAAGAALDTAGPGLASQLDYLGTVDCLSSRLPDFGQALVEELGLPPVATVTTRTSGTSPIDLLADACTRIRAGTANVALLGGAEAVKAFKEQRLLPDPVQPEGTTPARTLGVDTPASHPAETAAGLVTPTDYYPLFENAIRAADGASVADNDKRLGELWSRFAAVAADNPYAWVTDNPDAATILHSRMVGFPYRKLLTANIYVDQAAALVVCSAATAEAAGIPRSDWVFVQATAAANDHWFVGEREQLHRSPAVSAIGSALSARCGISVNELSDIDLYSCFPCAVRIAADELGIDLGAPTITGGLTFAGGPASNYVMHSLATLTDRVRGNPRRTGLCTAVGWFLTKHAAALLSATPPENGYTHLDAQPQVDGQPRRKVTENYLGPATVETYTATFDRAGQPEIGRIACLLPDGSRTFAASADQPTAARLITEDPIGAQVWLDGSARFTYAQ